MEILKLSWVVNFFCFALTLLFIWSKLFLIVRKMEGIGKLLTGVQELSDQLALSIQEIEKAKADTSPPGKKAP